MRELLLIILLLFISLMVITVGGIAWFSSYYQLDYIYFSGESVGEEHRGLVC